ncbi:hypothetical protein JKP88DRAFT_332244 [Tribonema minus]|uniref:Uncharacterized protein n=1 Tax=Tribonema minus TaxID=303371 RepID=A0A836CA03_9STRA|nr:hypothetical protein JKP88DRAFT_332244 [Tribonema minus]
MQTMYSKTSECLNAVCLSEALHVGLNNTTWKYTVLAAGVGEYLGVNLLYKDSFKWSPCGEGRSCLATTVFARTVSAVTAWAVLMPMQPEPPATGTRSGAGGTVQGIVSTYARILGLTGRSGLFTVIAAGAALGLAGELLSRSYRSLWTTRVLRYYLPESAGVGSLLQPLDEYDVIALSFVVYARRYSAHSTAISVGGGILGALQTALWLGSGDLYMLVRAYMAMGAAGAFYLTIQHVRFSDRACRSEHDIRVLHSSSAAAE